jgi:hypothetical protein
MLISFLPAMAERSMGEHVHEHGRRRALNAAARDDFIKLAYNYF